MGRKHFTKEEMAVLLRNPYVSNVNERSIVYSPEFKIRFIEEYSSGKRPAQIFRDAGFDTNILGSKRIERACARWKESYQSGTLGEFNDALESDEEKMDGEMDKAGENVFNVKSLIVQCHQQEIELQRLQAENKLLHQVYQMVQKQSKTYISNDELCQLIDDLLREEGYQGYTSYLCKAVGISVSTFYKYRRDSKL